MELEKEFDEKDYFDGRIKGRLYISKQFDDKFSKKEKRFAYKITESEQQEAFVKVKNDIILAIKHGGRHQLKALIIEDNKGIESLIIQTFTGSTGSPHKDAYSFRGKEIENLYKFLKGVKELSIETTGSFKIDDKQLDEILLSKEQTSKIVIDNQEAIIEAIRNNVTKSDIVALGYRKIQLDKFERLLEDDDFFETEKTLLNVQKNEAVWQTFFEQNTWILGYGLNYVFNTPLEGKKLEQVVSGSTVFSGGKRIDALMKTIGLINSLCFGEIKTHRSELIKPVKNPYRVESWSISDELAGGIAQSHRTIQLSIENIKTKTVIKDNEDNLTDEQVFLYKPKSFLIIGSLSEFIGDSGINETKYSSFEMYRRSIISPEIITFDELLERAKYIIKNTEEFKHI